MRVACAVALLLAGTAVYAQVPTPDTPILLDVVVDNARARAPLQASDFTVTEGGQPMRVEAVHLVQIPSSQTPLPAVASDADEATTAAAADRLVAIYVDEYHLSDDERFRVAREALATFIRTGLGPRDLVLVVKPLDSLVTLRLSADREAAARIVEGAAPRQGDYTARSAFEQDFIAGAPARIDAARSQIAWSALNALASHLGRFESGRKTLLVLSNGIDVRRPTRGDAPLIGLDGVARTANRARVAIYPFRPSSNGVGAGPRTAASDAPPQPDPLAGLAAQTTGFEIAGDDAVGGLQRMLRDASRYYQLTLSSSATPAPGRFQPVTVSVRAPGATVRARAGYARPIDVASLTIRTATLPEGLKVPRHTSTLIRTWFGQTAAGGGLTRVTFVWEPAPLLPVGRTTAVAPARVSLAVTSMDGAPVFAGTSMASGRELLGGAGEQPRLTFAAAPGVLLVQMDILDAGGRVLDRDVRDLNVGGFPAPLSFGSAEVYRARTPRDLRAILDGSGTASPVASRQFSRAEHLVVRVPVVSRDGEPVVTARLQSGFGAVLRVLTVAMRDGADDVAQVDVPLAALASGPYALEFTASSPLGTALDRVEFIVTP